MADLHPVASRSCPSVERYGEAPFSDTTDGVEVAYMNYDGVTHEFFGMSAVVDVAKEANAFVFANLKAAFGKGKSEAP